MPYKDKEKRQAYAREYNRKHGPEYRQRNRVKIRQRKNAYYKANSFRYHNSEVARKYGVTPVEYNCRLQEQDGKCAICRKSAEACNQRLAVDHNHQTKRVRGLLCNNCNRMLGNAKDSMEILNSAFCYLMVDMALGTGASSMPDEKELE